LRNEEDLVGYGVDENGDVLFQCSLVLVVTRLMESNEWNFVFRFYSVFGIMEKGRKIN
jgi:hypothetical protein